MAQQLKKTDIEYLDFSSIDSTHALGDSVVQAMRQRGPQGVQYQERKGRTLFYLRSQYKQGSDTLSATFYLNTDIIGIVAFKEN